MNGWSDFLSPAARAQLEAMHEAREEQLSRAFWSAFYCEEPALDSRLLDRLSRAALEVAREMMDEIRGPRTDSATGLPEWVPYPDCDF